MQFIDSGIYILGDVGILGGFGVGAPALAIKMEELIALGAKRFIAIGTTGTLTGHAIGDFILCPKALAEDGVAHHYLPTEETFSHASASLTADWLEYAANKQLPAFCSANAWSFSAIYRESFAHIQRVVNLGCSVVEMEAATLYAIAKEKNVEALSLFIVSDSIATEDWVPRLREPIVRTNLHNLATWAIAFCQ